MNASLAVRTHAETDLIEEISVAANFARKYVIAAIYRAGSGHPGGSLSCVDILACLFGAELNVWPEKLDDPNRDRFVLSKGHAAPALYAVAAHYGFCDPRATLALRKFGTPFQGHPHVCDLPWVETSTGSLAQGLSVALGMAMGLKLKNHTGRVYALVGDGELQEGEVWEAAMCAAHHKLTNLCAIVDYNKLQSDDRNEAIMGLEPLADKWRSFGWSVAEIDGHDIEQILSSLRAAAHDDNRPSVIIAHTTKGYGVPYMANVPAWHGSVKLTLEQAEEALAALGAEDAEIKDYLDV